MTQQCPRCGREVRSGLPWAAHRNWHSRQDRSGQPQAGRMIPLRLRGLDRRWDRPPEAW